MAYPDKPQDPQHPVQHWCEAGVAYIRFNRPQAMNAIDTALANAFLAACEDIARDPQVRVVWVSGEGRAFMAGGDIPAMRVDPPTVAKALTDGIHGGLKLLAELHAPVVASVHGAVAGGGLGVMLGCDLVVAAEGTKFALAYPLIGASCDCSTSWGLPRIVGLRKALELAFLADTLDGPEALRLGLVNRVVPLDALASETAQLVQRLANGPTQALGRMKRLMRTSFDHTLSQQLDAEQEGFLTVAATRDFDEGTAAFVGKRKPVFEGR